MREYLRVAFDRKPIAVDRRSAVARTVHRAISLPARWRLRRDFYAAPAELWLKKRIDRWTNAPKPRVDAQRLEAEIVTA